MTAIVRTGGFVNRMPRYEVLSEDAMATIERGWRRLMSEVGVRFDHPAAQRLFREAGQAVDDEGVVRLDPDFALEQIALAPATFELRARNPERTVTIGGNHMVFTNVAGPPFVYEDGVRR
ncbi:MAG: trimethylamine---corrinoid protein Co-methyltransferase, partial [bacterium]